MKQFLRGIYSLFFTLMVGSIFSQSVTFDNVPPLSGGGSTAGGIGFNFTAQKDVIVENLRASFSTASGTANIWYNPSKINGQPTISTANGWVNLGTATFAGISSSTANPVPQTIPIPLSVSVRAGDTVGFFIQWSGTVYSTTNTTTPTFTNGTVTIIADASCAYTSNAAMSSWFTPRQINGGVVYKLNTRVANNAGIVKLVSPVNFCQGNQNIQVQIANYGFKRMDSVRVNWQLDGGPVNTLYYNIPVDTSGSVGGNTKTVSLGTVNFAQGVLKNLVVWTSYPNGFADTITLNDTIYSNLKPGLNGVYTIGGSNPDYFTISDAVSDLNNFGICGPVTFRIRPGTYNERFTIEQIAGSSAVNNVKFIGAGKSLTTVTFTGSSASDFATILINGADYLTFRDMTIESPHQTFGVGILLTNGSDYNAFRNLNIMMNVASTATTTSGISVTGSSANAGTAGNGGNYNTFDSLYVEGAYSGIRMYGPSTSDYLDKNTVTNSTFNNQSTYGIYSYYQDGFRLANNIVKNMRAASSYGIYNYYGSNFVIEANYVNAIDNGIYNYYSNRNLYNSAITSFEINNMVIAGTGYGIFISNCNSMKVYHNSVVNAGTTTTATVYFLTTNNIDCRNNIFINTNTGNAVYFPTTANVDFLDYNNYYTGGTNLVYVSGTLSYTNLNAWKTGAPTRNVNSFSTLPGFVSSTDLHTLHSGFKLIGQGVGVTKDFDGETRSVTSPNVGADEKILVPNNAGVRALTGPVAFCTGNQVAKALIENAGNNKLDSVRVNWSIDGVLQPVVYFNTPIDTGGHASGNTKEVTLGAINFPTSATKTVKIWTSRPNGAQDTMNSNDTITARIKPSISGVLTVGPTNSDYTNLSDAILDMKTFGICGPVTVNIAAGTYNERITIPSLPGLSAVNTVSFIGAGKSQTILSYTASGTADMNTVLLDGADHIRFRDMTIEALGATYAVGVMFTNSADSNRFDNVKVSVSITSTSSTVSGIIFSGSVTSVSTTGINGNYNILDSMEIVGGYYGVRFYGLGSTTGYINGNVLSNSSLTSIYYYAVYSYYHDGFTFSNNTIKQMRNTTTYGIYNYYGSNFTIENNRVESNSIALYCYYSNRYYYNAAIKSRIVNNMLTANTSYGLYVSNSNSVQFLHNSVLSTAGTYTSYFVTTNNLVFKNNLVVNSDVTAGSYAVYLPASAGFDTLDYNNYFSASSELVYVSATVKYITLISWKLATPNFNVNSVSQDPGFVSNGDLHIKTGGNPGYAPFTGVALDIDGETRCDISAAMGADEPPVQAILDPIASISLPDSFFVNSQVRVLNTTKAIFNEPLAYTWYVDGSPVAYSKTLAYTFTNTGVHSISLKARNCSGYDSVSATVDVVQSTSSPVSDFIASRLSVLPLLETVQLIDNSDHGASAWDWTITPSLGVYFNPNEASPEVIFTEPGYYNVCLTASNANGQGNTVCKNAYIYVNDDVWINNDPSSNMPGGRISDEGWIDNYYANTVGSFVINPAPCASEIRLKFTMFDLFDINDSLRIYDGADNSGEFLGTFTAGSGLPGGLNGITAYSGKMYLEWVTSGSGQAKGFEAYWTSVADTSTTLPVANFVYPNKIFSNQIVTFQSVGTRNGSDFEWKFNNAQPGLDGGNKSTDRFSWNAAGVYDVKLIVGTCAGKDSITKQITVIAPSSAPIVGFYADQVNIPALTVVNFFDTSDQGPTSWKWSVNPANKATFETSANAQNTSIRFYAPGVYEIKLKATNQLGTDSLVKTAYINVFDYCTPAVSTINSDIGISRVKLGDIDNHSEVGVSSYTKYNSIVPAQKLYIDGKYDITIERRIAGDSMSRKVWIDWNRDGDFSDSLERVLFENTALTMSYTGTFTVPNFASIGTTNMRVGTSYSHGNNSACGVNPIGEFEDYTISILLDELAPVITVKANDTVYVEQWYQYMEAGADAMDNVDGDISSRVAITGTVDSSAMGTYYIRYNVSDNQGNVAQEVTRVVIVTADKTNPEITLNGASPVNHQVGTTYTDAGATATDYFNRPLTNLNSGNNINEALMGTYYFWYTVQDAAGNKDSVVRTVVVTDTIDPVLTLVGSNPLTVEVFGNINDPGVTAADNYYSSVDVTTDSSMVNKNMVGTYTIKYTATDSSGNFTVIQRTVLVKDTKKPMLTLIGAATITIDVHTSFNDPGVIAKDEYCNNVTWTVTSNLDTAVTGTYTINYDGVDCEGNTAVQIQRTVNVVDRIAPMIQLVGSETVIIARWQDYVDAGFTVNDNYDDSSDLTVVTQGTWVNSAEEGLFYIQYKVTDKSGNVSLSAKRYIDVRGTNSVGNVDKSQLKLYPNPSNGAFTISFGAETTSASTVMVTDLNGKVVATFEVNAGVTEQQFNLENVAGGLYHVRVIQGQQISTLKVSIVR